MSNPFAEIEDRSKKTVEHFRKELTRFRTGRANTGLLDGLQVEYYGSMVPLIQLGMVNAPEPRLITIQVYDAAAVDAIEKAIQVADLGISPSRDGNLIRLAVPTLTEDRRKDLIKKLHKLGEENKIVLRNHRRDAIDHLKKEEKDKKMSADDLRRGQEQVQKVVDKYIAEIDNVVTTKEKEILEV